MTNDEEGRLVVREMLLPETDMIASYFHGSSVEHLELLGVDPTRLPTAARWRAMWEAEYRKPIAEREMLALAWDLDGAPVGFSTCDHIVFGEQAYMHLHIREPQERRKGIGTQFVRQTASYYSTALRLKRLFCQPNAYNVAPNRTLQNAGFRYDKTYKTVPGQLNYHQSVTRWVYEVPPPDSSTSA